MSKEDYDVIIVAECKYEQVMITNPHIKQNLLGNMRLYDDRNYTLISSIHCMEFRPINNGNGGILFLNGTEEPIECVWTDKERFNEWYRATIRVLKNSNYKVLIIKREF